MKLPIYLLLSAVLGMWAPPAFAQLHWLSRESTQTASAESTEAVARYAFRKTGQKSVEIVSVSSSCGCTAAKPDKTLYQPGGPDTSKPPSSLGSRTGDQRKTIRQSHS